MIQSSSRVRAWLLHSAFLFTPLTLRAELEPRDTAQIRPPGSASFNLVQPSRYAFARGLELETQPFALLLLSPNASLRVALRAREAWRVTGEYGLSIPTLGMRLFQGYLFPSWESSERRVGWFVVPRVAAVVSHGTRQVWTARLETAFGVQLGPNDATPLDTYAPIELLFAPALRGFRSSLTVSYDLPISGFLRARVWTGLDFVGPTPEPRRSPFFWSAGGELRAALGAHARVSVGLIGYNYDQRESALVVDAKGKVHRQAVRSNDLFPSVDCGWSW